MTSAPAGADDGGHRRSVDTVWTRPGENGGNSGNTAWHDTDVFPQVSGMFWYWAPSRVTGFGRSTTSTSRMAGRRPDLGKRGPTPPAAGSGLGSQSGSRSGSGLGSWSGSRSGSRSCSEVTAWWSLGCDLCCSAVRGCGIVQRGDRLVVVALRSLLLGGPGVRDRAAR